MDTSSIRTARTHSIPPRDGISGWRYYSDTDVEQLREALNHLADERTLVASA